MAVDTALQEVQSVAARHGLAEEKELSNKFIRTQNEKMTLSAPRGRAVGGGLSKAAVGGILHATLARRALAPLATSAATGRAGRLSEARVSVGAVGDLRAEAAVGILARGGAALLTPRATRGARRRGVGDKASVARRLLGALLDRGSRAVVGLR